MKTMHYLTTLILAAVLLLTLGTSAMAKESGRAAGKEIPGAASPQRGPTDPVELGTFLDDLMAKELAEHHIAGAAVSVVKDGKLFFAKGYGYADLERKIPVDAEQTMFGIGSIGKTLTWTSVMQLAEQGKVDLNADVNKYLDFRIPDTYPQPITLKNLMTHTSGFEERWAGSVVPDASQIVSVRDWLVAHMAARVRPPGEIVAYSNFNPMLAGYIVSRVSGKSYAEYLQENIFNPLGMMHSTAEVTPPENLSAYVSQGYTYKDGTFQKFPGWTAQPVLVPSGGQRASVTDMARYMIAHLQNGRYSDAKISEARILQEATAKEMHTTQYTPDPRFRGMAAGFFDFSDNGERTIGHVGYAAPMNGLLLMLPDRNLGFYVVYNSAGGAELNLPHTGFHRAFSDHYFPAFADPPVQTFTDSVKEMGRFAGSYRETAFPYTSFMKVAALFGGMTAQIRDSGDGALLLNYRGEETRYVQVEPLYFRRGDGQYAILFREDNQGRITRMFIDPINYTALDKLEWYETAGFNIPLLAVCILIFLSLMLVMAGRFIWSRFKGDRKPVSRGALAAYWFMPAAGLVNVLIVAGIMWGAMGGGMQNELLDPPFIIKLALVLGIVSVALTIGALACTVLAWKDKYWGTAFRSYYTIVAIAAVAFVWFLNQWNLVGLRY